MDGSKLGSKSIFTDGGENVALKRDGGIDDIEGEPDGNMLGVCSISAGGVGLNVGSFVGSKVINATGLVEIDTEGS